MSDASKARSGIVQGIRWNIVTTVLRRTMSLALLLALASWLSQSDLGLFRTYSLILTMLTIFAVLGMDSNVITMKRHRLLAIHSFAQLGIGFSVIISIVMVFIAQSFGNLYHSKELVILLRCTSIFVVVEALRRLLRSIAQVRLKFKELALAETWNVVFYCSLSFAVIPFYRHVWVYVVAYYLGNLVECLFLAYYLKPIPTLRFKRLFSLKWMGYSTAIIARYKAFLLNVSAIHLLNTYAGNAPILFLGTFVEAASMGQYFFASQLIGVPVVMFTTAVGQVLYPVFAQSERERTITNINTYARLTLALGMPLLMLYAFGLGKLVPGFFGDKWNEAVALLFCLMPFFGSSMLNDPISGIPFVYRKPHYELVWNIVSLTLRIIALWFGLGYGFVVAVLCFSLVSALMNLLFYLMSLILLRASIKDALRQLLMRGLIIAGLGYAFYMAYNTPFALLYGAAIFALYVALLYLFSGQVIRDFMRVVL